MKRTLILALTDEGMFDLQRIKDKRRAIMGDSSNSKKQPRIQITYCVE